MTRLYRLLAREREGLIVLVSIGTAVAIVRWAIFSPNVAPPGSDGGQWLAFGHRLLGGGDVRAGLDSYPPVVPFVTEVASRVLPPMTALKIIGAGASLGIAGPLYLLARRVLDPLRAALVALLVIVAPYHTEVLTFGGYPQLAGTAFMIVALVSAHVALSERSNSTSRIRWAAPLLAGVFTGLTVATHILVAIELVVAMAALTGAHAWAARARPWSCFRGRSRAVLLFLVPALLVSAAALPAYVDYATAAERVHTSPINLSVGQVGDWLRSAWRWEFLLWGVAVLALVPLGAWLVLAGRDRVAVLGLAFLGMAMVGVAIVHELRFLQALELGVVLLTASVAGAAVRSGSRGPLGVGGGAGLVASVSLVVVFAAVLAAGMRRSVISYHWYSVVTNPVLDAMTDLRDREVPPGAIAVTSGAERGHNYGWWIEGYAHIPTYMAGEAYLFVGKSEREQVALAAEMLAPTTGVSRIRAIAIDANVRFVFADDAIVAGGYGRFHAAGFRTVFQNGKITVLERRS
jgi:hypothetical protein